MRETTTIARGTSGEIKWRKRVKAYLLACVLVLGLAGWFLKANALKGEVTIEIIRVRDLPEPGSQEFTVRLHNRSNRPITCLTSDGKSPVVLIYGGGILYAGGHDMVVEPGQEVEGVGQARFFAVLNNQMISLPDPVVRIDYHYGRILNPKWAWWYKGWDKVTGLDREWRQLTANVPPAYPSYWGTARPIPAMPK